MLWQYGVVILFKTPTHFLTVTSSEDDDVTVTKCTGWSRLHYLHLISGSMERRSVLNTCFCEFACVSMQATHCCKCITAFKKIKQCNKLLLCFPTHVQYSISLKGFPLAWRGVLKEKVHVIPGRNRAGEKKCNSE